MFQRDPAERITLQGILEHPWMKKLVPTNDDIKLIFSNIRLNGNGYDARIL